MSIDNLTFAEIKTLMQLCNPLPKATLRDDSHWEIEEKYFLRTVTYHFTGVLTKITDLDLVFTNCCWVADDGRFSDAMHGKGFNEQEPFQKNSMVIIGRGSLIDAVKYEFELPAIQK